MRVWQAINRESGVIFEAMTCRRMLLAMRMYELTHGYYQWTCKSFVK